MLAMANARLRSEDVIKYASPDLFRDEMYTRLKSSGLLDTAKSELRKRIFDQLRRDKGVLPDKPRPASIQEHMINTLVAEYLAARRHTCTLSVFLPEAALYDCAVLTHDDILEMLHIRPGMLLHSTIQTAKVDEQENRKKPFTLLDSLLQSTKVLGSACTSDASTNTQDDVVGRAMLQLTSVDQRHTAKQANGSCDSLVATRLADLQRDGEERMKLQIEAQVERVREIEVGQARMEEAAKWRKELAHEREELERTYMERVRRLRDQEDAATQRARDLQREAERSAFEQRQRMVAEDDRIRSLQQERERDIHARQAAVAAREEAAAAREQRCREVDIAASRAAADANSRADNAMADARKAAAAELASERAAIRTQRIEFEQERARILALRDEMAEATSANAAKDARIERLAEAKAAAESRAASHASEAHRLEARCSRQLQELEAIHADVFGGVAPVYASHTTPAGRGESEFALQRLCGEGEGLKRLRRRVQEVLSAHAVAEDRQRGLQAELDGMRQELLSAHAAAEASQREVGTLWQSMHDAQELLIEAREGRERALAQAEDCRLALKHAEVELREAESSAAAARAMRDRVLAAGVGHLGGPPTSPMHNAVWHEEPALVQMSSQAHVGSTGSSAAMIAQRLEQLEAEEGELQAEMATFREKMAQQQAQLQQSVRGGLRVVQERGTGVHGNNGGIAAAPLMVTPFRYAGGGGPASPLPHSGYAYSIQPPASGGMMGYADTRRFDGAFAGDMGHLRSSGGAHLGGGGFVSSWTASPVGGAVPRDVLAEHGNGTQPRSQSMRTTVEDVTHQHAQDVPADDCAGAPAAAHGEGPQSTAPLVASVNKEARVAQQTRESVSDEIAAKDGPEDKLRTSNDENWRAGHGCEESRHGPSAGAADKVDLQIQAHGSPLQCMPEDGPAACLGLSVITASPSSEQVKEKLGVRKGRLPAVNKLMATLARDVLPDSSESSSSDEGGASPRRPSFASRVLATAPRNSDEHAAPSLAGVVQDVDSLVKIVLPQHKLNANTAFVEQSRHEDAESSLEIMNGSAVHGLWDDIGAHGSVPVSIASSHVPSVPGSIVSTGESVAAEGRTDSGKAARANTAERQELAGRDDSCMLRQSKSRETDPEQELRPKHQLSDAADASDSAHGNASEQAAILQPTLNSVQPTAPDLRETSSASMVALSDLDVVGAQHVSDEADPVNSLGQAEIDQDDVELSGMDLAQHLADFEFEDIEFEDMDIL
eukprot:jgi/Ulvmu1/5606/UM023_0143.1